MRHFLITAVTFISLVSLIITAGCGQKKEQPPADTASVATTSGNTDTEDGVAADTRETPRVNLFSRVLYSARVYKESGASHYDIFMLTGKDPVPRRITADNSENERPLWSPDGGRIAYLSRTREGTNIIVRGIEDGNPRKLNTTPIKNIFEEVFIWPVQKEIYYATQSDDNNIITVWSVNPETLETRKYGDLIQGDILRIKHDGELIAAIDPWDGIVSVSAGGKYIARLTNGGMKAVCTKSDGGNVCEIPLAELAGRRITLGPWSPRADYFIIEQHAVTRFDDTLPPKILLADIQTRTVRALADGTDPVWSADGAYIIYTSPVARVPFHDLDRGDINVPHSEVLLVPSSGGTPVRLTSKTAVCNAPAVFAEIAPASVVDFARGGGVLPPVADSAADHGEAHMAPLPPATAPGASLNLMGEFTSRSGFTALQFGRADGGGAFSVIVASEKTPPTGGKDCEVAVYTLRDGRYVRTENRLGKMSREEDKYEKKSRRNMLSHINFGQGERTVGGGLARNTSIKFAAEGDILPGGGRERIIIYAVQKDDSAWQTFLAVYRPDGENSWTQAVGMALLAGSGPLPHVSGVLRDVDGDGALELLISQTVTLENGWRENLKIYRIIAG